MLRVMSAPGSYDSSCSMVRGPMIAAVTAGWLMTNAMARSIRVMPCLLGELGEALRRSSSLRWLASAGHVEPGAWAGPPRWASRRLSLRQRPDSQPPPSGL